MTRPALCLLLGLLCGHALASSDRRRLQARIRQAEHERDMLAQAQREVLEAACRLQQERDQAIRQVVLGRGRALMLVRDKFGTTALYDH